MYATFGFGNGDRTAMPGDIGYRGKKGNLYEFYKACVGVNDRIREEDARSAPIAVPKPKLPQVEHYDSEEWMAAVKAQNNGQPREVEHVLIWPSPPREVPIKRKKKKSPPYPQTLPKTATGAALDKILVELDKPRVESILAKRLRSLELAQKRMPTPPPESEGDWVTTDEEWVTDDERMPRKIVLPETDTTPKVTIRKLS